MELLMTCTLYLVVSSSLMSDCLSGTAVPRSVCSLVSLLFLLPCLLLTDLRPVSVLSLFCSLAHILIRSEDKVINNRSLFSNLDSFVSLFSSAQPDGHAVLSQSLQHLVLVHSVSVCGPREVPGLCGRHHLLVHLSDLLGSSRGQYGREGAVQCNVSLDSRSCLCNEDHVFFTGQWFIFSASRPSPSWLLMFWLFNRYRYIYIYLKIMILEGILSDDSPQILK